MAAGRVIVLSLLLATALSAPVQVDENSITLFDGEDFHIMLPTLTLEVTFKSLSAPRSPEVDLMRGGKVVHSAAKLNRQLSHLIIDGVKEANEGVYTVKDPEHPESIKRTKLIVRDCTNEEIIKYGENYQIPVTGLTRPLMLEYRPISMEANYTSRPALMLLTSTGLSRDGYEGRIHVTERQVILTAVTGADEGSYTVRDAKGEIKRKLCLRVKEHLSFLTLPYGKTLKINLVLNSSLVQLYYTPEREPTSHLLLDKGEFTSAREELGLQDRLSMEGSWVYLDQVTRSDIGLFEIKDILESVVSKVHLGVEPYKLESLYVAIIALLGLLVFLLLVCLLSCLIKVKKRAKRAAALEKLAHNAGKEDEGEAFRQVVKNITKLSEESKHSQADNTEKSQSTEVDIKGLEVSSKEVGIGNLETSDSGVGFNTALPLDTDTDAPDPTSESVAVTISAAPETESSPPTAAGSKPSAPPALEIKSSPVAETKTSPAPEIKKTPDPPVVTKLDLPKTSDVKSSPTPSPEPKAGLTPADPKPAPTPSPEPKAVPSPAEPKPAPTPSPEPKAGLSPAEPKPAPTPSPEPKPATPKATTPTPEIKSALTPTPEPLKPPTPEPITNGTPEPGPDTKLSPDHAEIISSSAPKAAPPKTPEVELKSSGATLEASKDGTDDTTTTTTTT
ncbi:neural cell adhesion molecule 1 isoform X2 [Notolabrus celidotus]|nr:neural cell adhesion molecule 1 isoform X2 [Notolabrus celidotus]XP_034553135.1 neural cell adhesion molecule 1 isoform X2 [Notolabrus celidotus]XP_034553136.1 neural cell adhesion molecule 1 isoform X2 [Notolabrus celidotus]